MEQPSRKNTRLETFDYNSVGAYFITICTQNKEHLLSEIKLTSVGTDVPDGPQTSKEIFVELTEYGKIADKYINQLNDFYENILVDDYIIMPNHIHLLISIRNDREENGPSRTPVPTPQNATLSKFISTFKRFSNKEWGAAIWQSRSFDHVIRDRRDYDEHVAYITENPMRWRADELYVAE